MYKRLLIVPIFQREAFAFIKRLHRHHKNPVGSVFQVAVIDMDKGVECTKGAKGALLVSGVFSYYSKDDMNGFVNHYVNERYKIVAVAVAGRPNGRRQQDGFTLEVTRLCSDGTKNACSMLYAACWRVCRELGYRKLITYILNTEPGTSLKATGWKLIGERGGGSWSAPSRPREDKHPLQPKLLFEIAV